MRAVRLHSGDKTLHLDEIEMRPEKKIWDVPDGKSRTYRYTRDPAPMRLTLVGAVYITVVCLLPEFLVLKWNVPFYFGGTSLLIIVVVTMDFMAQAQAYAMSHQYESLMKKSNLKGAGQAR